jgi:hypothetical protein
MEEKQVIYQLFKRNKEMKYSFFCKKCGFTSFSDDKKVIKDTKEKHKREGCFNPKKRGYKIRPDLIDKID